MTAKDKQDTLSQQSAIVQEINNNVAVAAGAGSGKTKVLISRYIYILMQSSPELSELVDITDDKKANVEDILAITFTIKAAAEMKGRLREALNDMVVDILSTRNNSGKIVLRDYDPKKPETHPYAIYGETIKNFYTNNVWDDDMVSASLKYWNRQIDYLSRANISTIDSLCNEIVHSNPLAAKVNPAFTMVDDFKGQQFIHNLVAEWTRAKLKNNDKDLNKLLENYNYNAIVLELIKKLEVATSIRKDGGVKGLEQYYLNEASVIKETVCAWATLLDEVYTYVQTKKDAKSIYSFKDISNKAIELLKNEPSARDAYLKKFKYIMVDEFQDTDDRQRELAYLLAGGNADRLYGNKLFVVGDAKQSIYRFRGADVDVFQRVRNDIIVHDDITDSDLHPELDMPMNINFRSRESILSFVDDIFKPLMPDTDPIKFEPLVPHYAKKAGGELPEVFFIPTGDRNSKENNKIQAELIACYIEKLKSEIGDKFKYKDIGILMRAMTRTDVLLPALQKHGIPFVCEAGKGFFAEQEIVDAINLLKLLRNTEDDLALLGVLRSPYFGVDDESLVHIMNKTKVSGNSFYTALQELDIGILSDEQKKLCQRARKKIKTLVMQSHIMSLESLWDFIWQELNLNVVMSSQINGVSKLANMKKLGNMIKEYEANQGGDIDRWLEYVAFILEAGDKESVASIEDADAVKVMTIHGSKGLGFEYVILPFLDAKEPAGKDKITYMSDSSNSNENNTNNNNVYGMTLTEIDDTVKHSPIIKSIKENEKTLANLERKRLFYVAVTRAKERLALFGLDVEGKEEAKADIADKKWINQLRYLLAGKSSAKIYDVNEMQQMLDNYGGNSNGISNSTVNYIGWNQHLFAPEESFDCLGTTIFTPSALQSYLYCQRRYYYEYALRIGDLNISVADADDEASAGTIPNEQYTDHQYRGELDATDFGQLVHGTLEHFSNAGAYDIKFDDCFHRSMAENIGNPAVDYGEAKTKMERYIASDIYKPIKEASQAGRVHNELRIGFYVEEKYKVVGIIDCLYFDSKGNMHIVDYKTGSNHDDNIGYGIQLALYKMVIEKLYGKNGKKVDSAQLHYLMEDNADMQVWSLPLNNEIYLDKAKEIFATIFNAKKQEADFKTCDVNENYKCKKCPYSWLCNKK